MLENNHRLAQIPQKQTGGIEPKKSSLQGLAGKVQCIANYKKRLFTKMPRTHTLNLTNVEV